VIFLCLTHDDDTRPGLAMIGDALLEQGHTIEVWNMAREGTLPSSWRDFDGYIIHGGAQNVGEEEDFPYLALEEEMIGELVRDERPLLGICLGGQLLAATLGAPVTRLERPEIGWDEVRLTAAAKDDPLFDGLPQSFVAAHWHYYHFVCPVGAVLLAENDNCHQAFRYGPRAWGVQFHPEATAASLDQWATIGWPGFAAGALDRYPDTPEERQVLDAWNRIGHQLAESFVIEAAKAPRRVVTR
jgi:GMP synthase (glutamine-hydrolysing)